MNDVKQGGFTIIELMLFISISALMTITLLVGWTVAINTQSYRDATRSLASMLQAEYNQTTNVVGERGAGFTCVRGSGAVRITKTTPATGQSRGTTDCVVMGRYIVLDNTKFTSTAVLGTAPAAPITSGTSDVDALRQYLPTKLDTSLIAGTTADLPWVSGTDKPNSNKTPIKTAILILRSPETGAVYTFSSDFPVTEPTADAVLTAANQTTRTICLDAGAPIAQPTSAVILGANASSATAVGTSTDHTKGANGC